MTTIRQPGAEESQRGMTLAAIGRRAGVSKATVSKVLNGRAGVAAGTRRRVQALLDAYGYASPGHGQSTTPWLSLVDVVMINFRDPWQAMVLAGFERAAARRDLSIVPTLAAGGVPDEALTRALGRGSRGLVSFFSDLSPIQASRLEARALPYVMVGAESAPAGSRTVAIDYASGVRQATEHLLGLGHRRIGLVLGPYGKDASARRCRGYVDALADAGMAADPALIRWGEPTTESGQLFTDALLDLPEPPSAVVVADDVVAIGAYRAIENRGLRIGADVSVIGFDDRPHTAWLRPLLTTVRVPVDHLGDAALDLLLDPPSADMHRSVQPKLIIRDSAQPLTS